MDNNEIIPICSSCGHRHIAGNLIAKSFLINLIIVVFKGVKCQICGHVGKSQIFDKMRVLCHIGIFGTNYLVILPI